MSGTEKTHLIGRPYSTRELAERWGVSDQHIRDVIAKGDLRFFRVGHLIRIPAAAVEEFECRTLGPSSIEAGGTPSGETPAAPAALPVVPKIVKKPCPR